MSAFLKLNLDLRASDLRQAKGHPGGDLDGSDLVAAADDGESGGPGKDNLLRPPRRIAGDRSQVQLRFLGSTGSCSRRR